MQRFTTIVKAVRSDRFADLGSVEILEESNLETLKIRVVPHEGIHKDKEYFVTFKFQENHWPLIYIDSEIYDKIKTTQYLKNQGKSGDHKGICIKHFSYAYSFTKNFKDFCNNKWDSYIYYILSMFNNLQDFEKGSGLKSNYKDILGL